MKKMVLLAMAVVLVCCTSCLNVKLNDIKKLEPSDNIVKNEYKMEAFSKIDVNLVANVKFVQSPVGDYRVLVRCPDNYVELFDFKVHDDKLDLGFSSNIHGRIEASDVVIIVCSPTLLQINSEGFGSIGIDSLKTPSLTIDNGGVANFSIKKLSTEKLTVESSGVGNIELTGVAKTVSFDCSGVGNINAEQLIAEEVNAEISGVGNISCYASERLIGAVDGVGSLKYGGHPQQKQISRNGVGKITEL